MKHAILVCVLLCTTVLFSQEKLKKAKEDLSSTSTSAQTTQGQMRTSNSSSGSYSDSSSSFDSDDKPFGQFLAEILFYTTVGVTFGVAEYRELNPYPYYNYGEYTKESNEQTKRSNIRIGTNYLPGKVDALELGALYKPIPLVGIEATYLRFSERNRISDEYLNISSLMANYYRIREKYVTAWWGLGVSYVGNEVDTYGFAYSLGTEIYPLKPLSIHVSWKESFINQSTVGMFKSQLKYHFKKAAVFTGFHHNTIGEQVVKGVTIGLEYTF